ncbi:MAG: alpha/beta hydrolase [Saprospiraceae bacterium]|nr:lysophospholipase [Bacteroidia bacterium]NNE16592.1 alpha/beta hydrolase [Saprospiraceae bacterium]NNL91514.1 alpha/beta hydrolase [Saprospiraceae bacterium]
MTKFLKFLGILILILIITYLLGPTKEFEKVNNDPYQRTFQMAEVDDFVKNQEAQFTNIKPDNQSQFIWKDSINQTEYSLLYLHGFSASHGEAFPIISNFADRYNCNTYLPRLYLHGLNDEDVFVDLTPKEWLESAKQAVAIAKAIGKKLIIMSTSTGSTLATYLAANDPDISALIMTSPNFDLCDTNSQLLVRPWGKQLFRYMMGGDYREWNGNDTVKKYWTTKNRIEAHLAIRDLLNQTMTSEIYAKITQPVFVGYYYIDDEKCDKIICISEIDEFGKTIQTPNNKIVIKPFGTARGHVITSSYMNSAWEDVQFEIFKFMDEIIVETKK